MPAGAPRGPALLARIEARQTVLAGEVRALGGRVILGYQRLFNGVWAQVPRAALGRVRALAGVKAVHRVGYAHVGNVSSVPFIGAPQVWSGLGIRGEGIRIAVIDTGIDYTHRDFGGPGTAAAYSSNDGRKIEPGTFPTAKVIDGYDFAGDAYRPRPEDPDSEVPAPDPDPLDQHGHGTHVAGTAAGIGVPGKVGAGVAPRALLLAYKVFGREAWTPDPVVLAGIERAVDPNQDGDLEDRADVINLSVADGYGLVGDPLSAASDRAAAVGCIVVAAAGNDGNRPYIVGTPGAASTAISVGASVDNGRGTRADLLTGFTARGPRRGDAALKPDLVAPGLRIVSARFGSGDGGAASSGTSMATPHVAGLAALMRQLHPGWSVGEIKALLMNTATPIAPDGESESSPYPVSLQGAGRVRAEVAARTMAVAYGQDGAPSLSFGLLPLIAPQTLTRTMTVVNKGNRGREFRLSADFSSRELRDAGVRLTLDPSSIVVAAEGEATARLSIDVDPMLLRRGTAPVEYDGALELVETTGTGETLHLPFHLIPQAVARTRVEAMDSRSQIRLSGTGARPSVVEVYTLAVEDPADSAGDADLRAVGVRARGSVPADRVLEFAIATHRPWTTASGEVIQFGIEIDNDLDSRPDYRLETSSDVVTLVNLATQRSQVSSTPAAIDYNQSVMRVTVRAADVGLGDGRAFAFLVTSDSLYGDEDYTRKASFDPDRPAFTPSATRLEFLGEAALTVRVDADARAAAPSRGLLLLYPRDAPGAGQMQIVPVP